MVVTDLIAPGNLTAWLNLAEKDQLPVGGLSFKQAREKLGQDMAALNEHTVLFYIGMGGIALGGLGFLLIAIRLFAKVSCWTRVPTDLDEAARKAARSASADSVEYRADTDTVSTQPRNGVQGRMEDAPTVAARQNMLGAEN